MKSRAILEKLRELVGHNDRASAYSAEATALRSATEQSPLHPQLRQHFESLEQGAEESLVLGNAVRDAIRVRIPTKAIAGEGHMLVLGGSGSGKSRIVASLAQQRFRGLLDEAIRNNTQVRGGMWIVDMKSEMIPLIIKLMADTLGEYSTRDQDRLLEALVVFNPFSESHLLPLQILRPDPGDTPDLLADAVTSLLNRVGGAPLGVRQETYLYHLVLMGMLNNLTLVDLVALIMDPAALLAQVARCPHDEVRAFFSRRGILSPSSTEGVLARLQHVLRTPTLRTMLEARTCVSFHELLANKVVFADLGSPPYGAESIGRFMSQFFMHKLARGVFQREQLEAERPVTIAIDEWQEALAGDGVAEQFGRLLSLSRSRGISFVLVSQSLAGPAQVDPSLPNVVQTNCNVQMLFRAAPQDARAMIHMLPVSGRRSRRPAEPWERQGTRQPFLGPAEELALLATEISNLPRRKFYYWNRNLGAEAILVQALHIAPEATVRNERLFARLTTGTLRLEPPRIRFLQNDASTPPGSPPAPVLLPLQGRPRRS